MIILLLNVQIHAFAVQIWNGFLVHGVGHSCEMLKTGWGLVWGDWSVCERSMSCELPTTKEDARPSSC